MFNRTSSQKTITKPQENVINTLSAISLQETLAADSGLSAQRWSSPASPDQVIAAAYGDITAIAATVGIDWRLAAPLVTAGIATGRKGRVTRKIGLTKADNGKTAVLYDTHISQQGIRYPFLTFVSQAAGGARTTWNGFETALALAKGRDIAISAKPIPAPAPAPSPNSDDVARRIKRFDACKNAFEATPALSPIQSIERHYLGRKGFGVAEPLQCGLDIRTSYDNRGTCLIYPLFKAGEIVGFQKLYSNPFTDSNGNTRDKDFIFLPDSKQGSCTLLSSIELPDHYNGVIYLCEGLATALSVWKATKLPTVVCLDAGNIAPVAESIRYAYPAADIIVAADNDLKADKPNVGILAAIAAIESGFADGYAVPDMAGAKCDFNDVHQANGLDAVKAMLSCVIRPESAAAPAPEKLPKLKQILNDLRVAETKEDVQKALWAISLIDFQESSAIDAEITGFIAQVKSIMAERGLLPRFNDEIDRLDRQLFYHIKTANSIVESIKQQRYGATYHADKTNAEIKDIITAAGAGLFIDCRAMGAGKTNLVRDVFDLYRNDLAAAKKRYPTTWWGDIDTRKGEYLIKEAIAHRVSLIKSLSERLKIANYQSAGGMLKSERALCVNSLLTCRKSNLEQHDDYKRPQVLFIDEVRQTLEAVLVTGKVKNRYEIHSELITSIKEAKIAICADADLDEFTLGELVAAANGKRIHIFYSTPKQNGTTIRQLACAKRECFDAIISDLDEGRPVWVALDSSKQVEKLSLHAKESGHDSGIIAITSENKGDFAWWLMAPNATEFPDGTPIKAVFASPVISSGLSIENGYYTKVYGLFNGVVAPNEILQSLSRVRGNGEILIHTRKPSCRIRETVTKNLLTGIALRNSRYGEPIAEGRDAFIRKQCEVITRSNRMRNDYVRNFYLIAPQKGFQIGLPLSFGKSRWKMSALTERQIAEKAERLLKADYIADCAVIGLQQKPDITQVESDQLSRWKVGYMAGKNYNEVEIEDCDFYLRNGLQPVLNRELATYGVSGFEAESDKAAVLSGDSMRSLKSLERIFKGFVEKVQFGEILSLEKLKELNAYLTQHAKELTANGIGNYRRKCDDKMLVKRIASFCERLGFDVEQVRSNSAGKRFYAITAPAADDNEPADLIVTKNKKVTEYVERRRKKRLAMIEKTVESEQMAQASYAIAVDIPLRE